MWLPLLSYASIVSIQPISPLELVKAARKAHGESTDVGSESDLWGEDKNMSDGSSGVVRAVRTSQCVHVIMRHIHVCIASVV